ncbi:uncharacterized protein L3040_002141 [Drepanopeziza brunnea f. sp. 'multigermtubi']|uniref:Regulator of phospholipase D SRF1 n=1 Tax=Marssonina brunnea f. sp. multigermtubi (strain MB_m1) TaxID=1072389 RepID=K1WLZ6_MARBU|nr:uncharacterized protein MBM_02957 [Drepanopeziza brunnea f. sp. 'multigermtubi' MB_m1]EKD18715.1 hypothetical protein MBM_02957 [Drepanopeziza brunnea f. sp. 'multigermtubi' MB_m1]KAJ5052391.1 hypothetical protein L3040_002141 [Drepanopeziza brunnea f. sp. 'multigermtubi']
MAASDALDNVSLARSSHKAQLDSPHILQYGPPPQTRRTGSGSSNGSPSASEAMRRPRKPQNPPSANSSSSRNTQASGSIRGGNAAAHRAVKSLPPWVASYEDEDDIPSSQPSDRVLSSLPRAHSAQHHYAPTNPTRRISQDGFIDSIDEETKAKNETGFFGGHREPVKGRKWDHIRDSEPVIMHEADMPSSSAWVPFIKSSMYAPARNEDRKIVTPEFLRQQTPGYDKPWRGDLENGEESEKFSTLLYSKKKRKTLLKAWEHHVLFHPIVPLLFRITVFITSVVALSISSSIHHLSNNYSYSQNASTTMAIVVDVVAIPYILYITWDEYTGKPLGLRSPKAKIRLVLLDVFFIIFESANTALAFGALTDADGACKVSPESDRNSIVCGRVKALCAILMIALNAWSLTFSVSIFRLVERVGAREDGD